MELVCNPKGHAPVRRPNSVRRTSTLDSTWPDGHGTNMHIEGRCRDLITRADIADHEVARYDEMSAELNPERLIKNVRSSRVDLSALVGARGGGHLRAVLDEKIHEERVNGTPLYLLLDDISGVSLVSGWAWSRWDLGWMEDSDFDNFESRRTMMENVCTGFATGNSALTEVRPPDNNPQVVPLPNPEDLLSWHELPTVKHAGFRRARRIDVWVADKAIQIDVGFQDSASDPELDRVAIHEYHVTGSADLETLELTRIDAIPHVLPFPECPGAIANIQKMIGTSLLDMRARVIETLPGVLGCTHLNDVLRSLAEVPSLAERVSVN